MLDVTEVIYPSRDFRPPKARDDTLGASGRNRVSWCVVSLLLIIILVTYSNKYIRNNVMCAVDLAGGGYVFVYNVVIYQILYYTTKIGRRPTTSCKPWSSYRNRHLKHLVIQTEHITNAFDTVTKIYWR